MSLKWWGRMRLLCLIWKLCIIWWILIPPPTPPPPPPPPPPPQPPQHHQSIPTNFLMWTRMISQLLVIFQSIIPSLSTKIYVFYWIYPQISVSQTQSLSTLRKSHPQSITLHQNRRNRHPNQQHRFNKRRTQNQLSQLWVCISSPHLMNPSAKRLWIIITERGRRGRGRQRGKGVRMVVMMLLVLKRKQNWKNYSNNQSNIRAISITSADMMKKQRVSNPILNMRMMFIVSFIQCGRNGVRRLITSIKRH